MAKKDVKGKKGDVVKYIARSQAVRKLQITLAQFRRLCILKGIYPVEPKNKRSTALKTFYYRKDIAYLFHEPILNTLRQEKIHQRKLGKALGKKQFEVAKQIHEDKPIYTLDHIVKERYPSFIDALRDLDDALSMIALFATLPADDKIPIHHVKECQRLLAEFQNYIVLSHSLKKTFLSIKGIYYQVEIKGQTITWIAPYQFTQNIPHDVDFRVMSTFLEIHETLLSFVNYKLYSDLNLIYPPKLDQSKLESDAGLSSYIMQSVTESDAQVENTPTNKKMVSKSKKQMKTLNEKMNEIQEHQMDEDEEDEDISDADNDDGLLDVPEPVVEPTTQEETVLSLRDAKSNEKHLFANCVFWISREVPKYSLEFVIKAMGGECGWDATTGSGSPYDINHPKITHHITDRPPVKNATLIEGREYLQPQWIYDCINASHLVKTNNYHPGEKLNPHLSPFVKPGEDDYSPDEPMKEETVTAAEVDAETAHQQEVHAEKAGVKYSEFQPVAKKAKKSNEEEEAKELSKMMMSKRDKKLYDKIQFGKNRKQEAAKVLREKRKKIVKSKQ
ncbi:mRNA-binding ribosome synthesis protein nop7 [Globomyces sp. JEL0801]|nr:mRNA-binding ribosome synthesis protein nop7 [Globomyces sp. JEL0801]